MFGGKIWVILKRFSNVFYYMFIIVAGYHWEATDCLALIMGILSNVFAYWYSDKVILSMYKAKLVNQNDSPELIKIVSDLTTNADLPTPAIYIIEDILCLCDWQKPF